MMDAVRQRVDAQPRQAQHRPREVGDGRIAQRRFDRDDVVPRTHRHQRDRRRFQHSFDRGRRRPVAGRISGCRRREQSAGGGGKEQTAREHWPPVRYDGGASYAGRRAT